MAVKIKHWDRPQPHHDEVGQMEDADDALIGEIIDVSSLDLDQLLAADESPLSACIRRLIRMNNDTESTTASFDNYLGE